jgi:hypothetical protein
MRALGATLMVTGAMLTTASRRAATGPRREVGSLVGTAILAFGALKIALPDAALPLLGSLRWPRDGLAALLVGAMIAAMSLWRARR